MSMNDPNVEELIVEITKQVVELEAPEEMPLFDELVQDYFENPEPRGYGDEDDPLAFGVGPEVVALTPVVTAMVTAVITSLLKDAAVAVKDGGLEALKESVKDLLNPKKDNEEARALNDSERLKQIRKEAYIVATEWGVKPKKAGKMASDLAFRLATLET